MLQLNEGLMTPAEYIEYLRDFNPKSGSRMVTFLNPTECNHFQVVVTSKDYIPEGTEVGTAFYSITLYLPKEVIEEHREMGQVFEELCTTLKLDGSPETILVKTENDDDDDDFEVV